MLSFTYEKTRKALQSKRKELNNYKKYQLCFGTLFTVPIVHPVCCNSSNPSETLDFKNLSLHIYQLLALLLCPGYVWQLISISSYSYTYIFQQPTAKSAVTAKSQPQSYYLRISKVDSRYMCIRIVGRSSITHIALKIYTPITDK